MAKTITISKEKYDELIELIRLLANNLRKSRKALWDIQEKAYDSVDSELDKKIADIADRTIGEFQ